MTTRAENKKRLQLGQCRETHVSLSPNLAISLNGFVEFVGQLFLIEEKRS
jgi:hypothetical protein